MRVLVETERTLVVEAPGNRMKLVFLCVVVPVIVLHAAIFYPQFASLMRYGRSTMAISLVSVSLIVYCAIAYLALVTLRDKVTVTFHGSKATVVIEHVFPFGIAKREEIRFKEIEQFEISSPETDGFCRLRMKDGHVRLLFRIGKDDNYEVIRRLDMTTRQKVVTIG